MRQAQLKIISQLILVQQRQQIKAQPQMAQAHQAKQLQMLLLQQPITQINQHQQVISQLIQTKFIIVRP
jgi:hypothetical protein